MKEISEKEFYKMLDDGQERFDGISLKNVNIQDRKLNLLYITNSNFENVKFSNSIVYNLDIEKCNFNHCHFFDLQFDEDNDDNTSSYDVVDSHFTDCEFENIQIDALTDQSNMGDTIFLRTRFDNIHFHADIEICGVLLEECKLIGVDFLFILYDSTIQKTIIENSKIQGGFSDNTLKDTKIYDSFLEFESLKFDYLKL